MTELPVFVFILDINNKQQKLLSIELCHKQTLHTEHRIQQME